MDNATAAALAAQWSNMTAWALSGALGVNVTEAYDPAISFTEAYNNVTVSSLEIVDCEPGYWGANGECIAVNSPPLHLHLPKHPHPAD